MTGMFFEISIFLPNFELKFSCFIFCSFHILRSLQRLLSSLYEFFINFDLFFFFLRFWRKLGIQDGGARWPPLKNDDVVPPITQAQKRKKENKSSG